MKVWLDQSPCPVDASSSVLEAINTGISLADQAGRMIVDVIVDGSRWSPEQLDAIDSSAQAAEVHLVSANPRELVRETFAQAEEALLAADALQCEAAQLIQADRASQAMELLRESTELWQAVQGALVNGCDLAQIDLNAVTIDNRPFSALVADLTPLLVAIRVSLQNRDPVGLADTLLYDMPPVVAAWRQLFLQLREQLTHNPAMPA